jgi:hypothetical protein
MDGGVYHQLASQGHLVLVDASVGLEDLIAYGCGVSFGQNHGHGRVKGVAAIGQHRLKAPPHTISPIGIAQILKPVTHMFNQSLGTEFSLVKNKVTCQG